MLILFHELANPVKSPLHISLNGSKLAFFHLPQRNLPEEL